MHLLTFGSQNWNMEKKFKILRAMLRSSHQEVLLERRILKICSKFTGEHTCQSVISIKLQSIFTEITIRHGCSPVNLLHIFRAAFLKSISWWLLLSNITKTENSLQANANLLGTIWKNNTAYISNVKQPEGARREANGKLLLKIKLVSQLVALAIARNYRKIVLRRKKLP